MSNSIVIQATILFLCMSLVGGCPLWKTKEIKRETKIIIKGSETKPDENTISSFDEYDKYFAKMDKEEIQKTKNEYKNNPCYNMLGIYGIVDENKKNNFFEIYNQNKKQYQTHKKNNINKKTRTSIFDIILHLELYMSENILSLETIEKSNNEKAILNTGRDINGNETKIAIEKINNLFATEILKEDKRDILLDENNIKEIIENCFFAFLEKNINQTKYDEIRSLLDNIINDKDLKKNIKKNMIKGNRVNILEAFHEICKFHNLSILTLPKLHFIKQINVKGRYESCGKILNKIYEKILKSTKEQ